MLDSVKLRGQACADLQKTCAISVLYRNANTSSNNPCNCMQQIDNEAASESNYQLCQNTFSLISPDVRVTPAAVAELEERRID